MAVASKASYLVKNASAASSAGATDGAPLAAGVELDPPPPQAARKAAEAITNTVNACEIMKISPARFDLSEETLVVNTRLLIIPFDE